MRQFLIDTHVALWLISNDRDNLPDAIRKYIEELFPWWQLHRHLDLLYFGD